MELHPEIETALKHKRNILLTGGAGVGKTYQTNLIIKYLNNKGISHAKTASTGFASTHINGTTIHSFSGLNIFSHEDDLINLKRNLKPSQLDNIRNKRIVIIDEISMLSAYQLDLINKAFQYACGNDILFGGKQMILVGDFFQLPPVITDERHKLDKYYWAFYADCFRQGNFKCINLTKVMRQKNEDFIKILNEARMGKLESSSIYKLLDLDKPMIENSTQIYGTNREVDKANNEYLETINNDIVELNGGFSFTSNNLPEKEIKNRCRQMLSSVPVNKIIQLKKDTRVMIRVNNAQDGYFNGSIGYFLYECNMIDTNLSITGKYDELVQDMIENCFQENIHYKLIYSEKTGMPTGIIEFNKEYFDKICSYMEKFYTSKYNPFSKTRYLKIKLLSGEYVYVKAKTWDFSFDQEEGTDGQIKNDASFTQYPISIARAITSHKSQGCTLENVYLDFTTIKQYGQGYVCLSRAKSMEGLAITKFNTRAIRANPDVIAFYNRINNGQNF